VHAQAHLLLNWWRHHDDEDDEVAVMLGNAIELAALRALLASGRIAGSVPMSAVACTDVRTPLQWPKRDDDRHK
jgi:hypothetical protein